MKILFLTLAEVDDRSFGGAMRGNDIRHALCQVGQVDTLVIHGASRFTLDADWDTQRVRRATFTAYGFSREALKQRWRIRAWAAGILAAKRYDVIVARYLGLALFVSFKHWQRLVLDADDIFKTPSAGTGQSTLGRFKIALRNKVAARLLGRARHVWLVNPQDAARAPAGRTSLLANAISLPDRRRNREIAIPHRILMVGYFEHPPNADGLSWFTCEVLPALLNEFPHLELHAIGKHAVSFKQNFASPVMIRGFVDDLTAEYDQAALVIIPIWSGGGTQIKVLDALAHGRPVVSSPFAHAGFASELVAGESLWVASTVEDWIACSLHILKNPTSAAAIGLRGEQTVHEIFGVDRMTETVNKTLQTITR